MKDNLELDELGRQWYQAKTEGNTEKQKILQNRIFQILYMDSVSENRIKKDYKSKFQSYEEDIYAEIVSTFFIEKMKNFNPDIKSLSAYVTFCFKNLMIDIGNKIVFNISRKKTEDEIEKEKQETQNTNVKEKKWESVRYFSEIVGENHEGSETELGETISSKTDEYSNSEVIICFSQILPNILEIQSSLKGRANNDAAIRMYSLFTTEVITSVVKEYGVKEFMARERDILKTIVYSFLDYYMMAQCRSLKRIYEVNLKDFIEMNINGKVEKNKVDFPLSNPIYIGYFKDILKEELKPANLSTHRTKYQNIVKGILSREM